MISYWDWQYLAMFRVDVEWRTCTQKANQHSWHFVQACDIKSKSKASSSVIQEGWEWIRGAEPGYNDIYIYTRFWSLDIIFKNLQNGYGPGAWVNNCQTIRSGGSISTGHEYWIVLNHMTDYAAFGGFSKPQVLDIFAGRRCPKFPLVKFLQTWVETSHILESWRYMISMLIPSQPLTFKDTLALDALVAPRMTSCDPELGLGHGFVGALAMIYTMYIVRWSSIQGKSIRTRPWWGG